MGNLFRLLLHTLVLRPLVRGLLGVNQYHDEQFPVDGPAVIVANHNSHLDTVLIMAMFQSSMIGKIRPVGAMDYFSVDRFFPRLLSWLFQIIFIHRGKRKISDGDPLQECSQALCRNEILIIFPEGTRGDPGVMEPFKPGISHLAKRFPDVPVIPVFIDGLEMVLPRGAYIPVPFVCNVSVGRQLRWQGSKLHFMNQLQSEIERLKNSLPRRPVTQSTIVQTTTY